jgi:nitrate/nitrite-specific signal transduction histidine kinase
VGFDVEAPTDGGEHFGLIGMRERAAVISGELNLDSQPGEGTRVMVRVPLNGSARSPMTDQIRSPWSRLWRKDQHPS